MNLFNSYTNAVTNFGTGALTCLATIAFGKLLNSGGLGWEIQNANTILNEVGSNLPSSFSVLFATIIFFGVYAIGSITCRFGEAQSLLLNRSVYKWRCLLRTVLKHENENLRNYCLSQVQMITTWQGVIGITSICALYSIGLSTLGGDWKTGVGALIFSVSLNFTAHIAIHQKKSEIAFLISDT